MIKWLIETLKELAKDYVIPYLTLRMIQSSAMALGNLKHKCLYDDE